MNLRSTHIKSAILTSFFLVFFSCSGNAPAGSVASGIDAGGSASIDINLLGEGTEIRNSGRQLMNNPLGILEIHNDGATNDSVLVITVHGYESQGYEWITGLKNLTEYYGSVYFYRYDWEQCPDVIGKNLADEIKALYKEGEYDRICVFAHSYGGMVATFAASSLDKMNADINVIAAPLSGFPRLLDDCGNMRYGKNDKLEYPEWHQSINLIQYRTVHAQDGAFRDLAIDPQDIDLPFHHVVELPPTMDGHRLGHNWSVTWVLDKHVGKPHRY